MTINAAARRVIPEGHSCNAGSGAPHAAHLPATIELVRQILAQTRARTRRQEPFVRGESPSPGMLRRGDQILKPLRFLSCEAKVVCHHHERYDGRGHPDGLKGEASRSSPGSSRWRTRSTQ